MNIAAATAGRRAFDRLVESVAAAEGAFRNLVRQTGRLRDLVDELLEAERKRLALLQRMPVAAAAATPPPAGSGAGQPAQSLWDDLLDRLSGTFETLFDRLAKSGRLAFRELFDGLGALAGDLLGRLTGFDLSPLVDALGKAFGAGGLSIGGTLGKAAGLLGPLLGPLLGSGRGDLGGLLKALFGGSGPGSILGSIGSSIGGFLSPFLGPLLGPLLGGGSLAAIPGINLVTAALPLVGSLFADKDYPFAAAGIAAAGGRLGSTASALDDGPIEQVTRLGEQVAQTLQDLIDQLGGTVGDLGKLTAIGYSSGRKAILPKGFFAGVDETRGADFATGAVFSGIDDPEEATLRAVQAGLLRALRSGAVTGVEPEAAASVQVGLRRALAADFATLEDGLADIAFLRDFPAMLERLGAAGDAAAQQRLDLRERGAEAGRAEAERIGAFLERASRLFAPLGEAAADPLAADPLAADLHADDALAADRLAAARAAVDDYVRSLLGIADAAADTRPLTGYALQLAEAEASLDGLSAALREAGYSAAEAATLIEQGGAAARDRLRGAYEDDVGRDLRSVRGLGIVDRVADLVAAHDVRHREGTALGADTSGLDELLRLQVEQLVAAGDLSVAALEALRAAFAGNAVVSDALAGALTVQAAAANDNAAAQLTLADVTRLATRELDAQIREQEEIARSAGAVVDAIADTRRRLALDASLSVLSPAEQLDGARRYFEDLSGRALAGDQLAQAELPQAGEAYLELARGFYASNEDYARIFRQVDDALRDTGEVADRQLQVAEQQLEELRELRRALTGELGGLPNPGADFGYSPTRNRILARITGYAGDFGSGGFGAFRAGLSPEINALVDAIASSIHFADGGVMTGAGALQLHRYAAGGVAHAPQLALFGEGRMPEAFVPLPDGRSIPVTVAAPAGPPRPPDAGASRRTAGIETLVEETRRLRAELAGLRSDNAALRRGLERLAAGITTGRAA